MASKGHRAELERLLTLIPRQEFLPVNRRRYAELDMALDIGYGVTNSQPSTVVDMLELLEVQPGDRVLDVGSGSGWTTSLLAELAGPGGSVTGVELIPELVDFGGANLRRLQVANARIVAAEIKVLGLPAEAPFERILVSAMARTVPMELVSQLAVGGVLVIPVAGTMLRIERKEAGHEISRHGAYLFVPLRQR